ncbi:hypothetical protein QFC20_006069 [Naganishia adeliensis]|uniref:Uncharacterized protein n=1 Tax=Naganishia adeliensis TaxID=92952 RepID=A0ACC2VFX7_9TREE|nr:hypothetical protein QFC20_006069 [Naganishia adeliensis]
MSTAEPRPTEALVVKRHVRPMPEVNRAEEPNKVEDKLEEIGKHVERERQKLKRTEERQEVEQRDSKAARNYSRVQMKNREKELTALRKDQLPGSTAGVAAPLQSSTSVNLQPGGEEQGSGRVHRVGVPGNKRGRSAREGNVSFLPTDRTCSSLTSHPRQPCATVETGGTETDRESVDRRAGESNLCV